MKVLFTFGGIPHYLNALLNKLESKGLDVVVVSPQDEGKTIGSGVKLVQGGVYRQILLEERKMFYGKSGFPGLKGVLETERPDFVVLGWPYYLQVFFQPLLLKTIQGLKIKLMIREIPFQTPPFGQIRRYFKAFPMYNEDMRLLSKGLLFHIRQFIIARIRKYCYGKTIGTLNYSSVAYNILPSYGIPLERIHVTYNSSDTETLLKDKAVVEASPRILPLCDHRVLHIGRLVRWKRVDLLIEAFSVIARKFADAELVIVGNGPEWDNLHNQVEVLGLGNRVRFVGAVYDAVVLGQYMLVSDVYVLAGMGGLSINDAMTYGLPVVCSVCDGTERDLVQQGVNGFFFEQGNAADLAKRINELFSSPDLCKRMGINSIRIIRDSINLETVTNRYVEAFKHVASLEDKGF